MQARTPCSHNGTMSKPSGQEEASTSLLQQRVESLDATIPWKHKLSPTFRHSRPRFPRLLQTTFPGPTSIQLVSHRPYHASALIVIQGSPSQRAIREQKNPCATHEAPTMLPV